MGSESTVALMLRTGVGIGMVVTLAAILTFRAGCHLVIAVLLFAWQWACVYCIAKMEESRGKEQGERG